MSSVAKLATVKPRLQECVAKAVTLCKVPFVVITGNRTQAEQDVLYAKGRTTPGPEVTWVRVSNHTGGRAVDLGAIKDGSIDWHDVGLYDSIADAMEAAAKSMTPPLVLREGMDWNCDGIRHQKGETDMDHFEIKEGHE